VIVDDNSPDGTADIAAKLNRIYGNIVVRRRGRKQGLGTALVEGLKTALAMDDVDRIVTLDGDFSHNPIEIPHLLSASQGAGLVQGSRYVQSGSIGGWSLTRRLTSHVANIFCRLFLGTGVHDCTGNFRVYSRECAQAIVRHTRGKGFEWVVEAAFAAKKCGFVLKEVPIGFTDRKNGSTKLKAIEIVNWAFFALKNIFSFASRL
jgi:dolichol-phosphate mannosyltransferase